jgi:hypothetical protein
MFTRPHGIISQKQNHSVNKLKPRSYNTRYKKKLRKTTEIMEGFHFAIPITDFNRHHTGKYDHETNSTLHFLL